MIFLVKYLHVCLSFSLANKFQSFITNLMKKWFISFDIVYHFDCMHNIFSFLYLFYLSVYFFCFLWQITHTQTLQSTNTYALYTHTIIMWNIFPKGELVPTFSHIFPWKINKYFSFYRAQCQRFEKMWKKSLFELFQKL